MSNRKTRLARAKQNRFQMIGSIGMTLAQLQAICEAASPLDNRCWDHLPDADLIFVEAAIEYMPKLIEMVRSAMDCTRMCDEDHL